MKYKILIGIVLFFIVLLVSIPLSNLNKEEQQELPLTLYKETQSINSQGEIALPSGKDIVAEKITYVNEHNFLEKEGTNIAEIDLLEITNNFELKGEFTKHTVNLFNKGNTLKVFDYSHKIKITYNEVYWNGTYYILTDTPQKLEPYYYEGQLIAPNIFIGEENARTNFQDIAQFGGYALIYNNTIELRVDDIILDPGEELFIDPTYVNATDGFKATGLGDVAYLCNNDTNIFVWDISDDSIDMFDMGGVGKGTIFTQGTAGDTTMTCNDTTFFFFADGSTDIIMTDYLGNAKGQFDTGGAGLATLGGMASNGTSIIVCDRDNELMALFHGDGTFKNSWDISDNSISCFGMGDNITDFYPYDDGNGYLFRYVGETNQTNSGFNFKTLTGGTVIRGITTNGSDFWGASNNEDFIYRVKCDSGCPVTVPPNDPPTIPVLNLPNNNTLINFLPTLNWTNSTDDDGNTITYILEVALDGDFTTPEYRNVSIAETPTPTGDIVIGITIDGNYSWRVKSNDGTINSTDWSEIRTFILDISAPQIFIDSPTNTSLISNVSINLNFSIIEVTLDSIWYNLDDTTNLTITENITFNTSNAPHKLTLCANDSFSNENCSSVSFDINIPPTIPDIFPSTFTRNFSFNGNCANSTDEDLDTINYVFLLDGNNPPTTVIQNSTLTSLTLNNQTNGTFFFMCEATDAVSNSTPTSITTYDIDNTPIWNSSVSLDPTLSQGSSTDYFLNITFNNISEFVKDVSATIEFDGEELGMSKVILDANTIAFARLNEVVPLITTREVLFNVSFEYFNGTIDNEKIGNFTQTINPFGVGNCTDFATEILNYSIFDEETREFNVSGIALTNISIEVDITLTSLIDSSISWNYSTINTTANTLSVCVQEEILNTTNYSMTAIAKYSSQDRVVEYNHIQNFTLTNDNIPQNINLYDLLSEDSTSFVVKFRDEFFVPVSGAVIDLQRQYISDGIFLSVEHGLTDIAGQTVLHLVAEEVIYKFIVRKDGQVVFSSPELLAICQAIPCEIDLEIDQGIVEREDWGQTENLDFSLSLNEDARTVTLIYATEDGSTAGMFIETNQSDAYNNITACINSQTSSAGSLTCVVPFSSTNTTYFVTVLKDGEFVISAGFSLSPTPVETFGNTIIIMSVLLFLTLVLIAIESIIAMIVLGILGLTFAGYMTIFAGGSGVVVGASIVWLIIAGMIIIWKAAAGRHN